jgi:hypothetical protein
MVVSPATPAPIASITCSAAPSQTNEVKLTELTSVKQGRDESIYDYFKRVKDTKNRCSSLPISEKDLADLAFDGLCSHFKENLKVFIFLWLTKIKLEL